MEKQDSTVAQSCVRCRKCRTEKSPSQFQRSARHRGGLFPWCKECKAAYDREWWAANQHKHKEYDSGCRSEWRKANPEKVRAIVKRQNAAKLVGLKADYIHFLLRKQGIHDASPDTVAAFREILKVKRLVKEMKRSA